MKTKPTGKCHTLMINGKLIPATAADISEAIAQVKGRGRIKFPAAGGCKVCGRRLKNPIHVKAGIGPICAKRGG